MHVKPTTSGGRRYVQLVESYRDEARRRVDGEAPRNMDEPSDCIWRGAETPFASNH